MIEPEWTQVPAAVSVPPPAFGEPLPPQFAQAFGEMFAALAAGGGTLNGAGSAVDCERRLDDCCGAGLVDAGFRRQHWCALPHVDGQPHLGAHRCPGCSIEWEAL